MTYEENEKRLAYLKNIVLNMPDKPGSYQFYDEDHIIIYVGKAKRLKHTQVFASPTNTFRGYLRPELSTKIMELTMAPFHISEA